MNSKFKLIITKIKDFVKINKTDIILVTGVILISLLSFAMGYIYSNQQNTELLRIEEPTLF